MQPPFSHTCMTALPAAGCGALHWAAVWPSAAGKRRFFSLIILHLIHTNLLTQFQQQTQCKLRATGREERIWQASGGGNYFSPVINSSHLVNSNSKAVFQRNKFPDFQSQPPNECGLPEPLQLALLQVNGAKSEPGLCIVNTLGQQNAYCNYRAKIAKACQVIFLPVSVPPKLFSYKEPQTIFRPPLALGNLKLRKVK